MSLIENIQSAMLSDDEDPDYQSTLLTGIYEDATTDQKAKLDEAMICVCGWSLDSLIAGNFQP